MSNNLYDKYYQEFYAKNNLTKGGNGGNKGQSHNCNGSNIVNTHPVNIPNCSSQDLQNMEAQEAVFSTEKKKFFDTSITKKQSVGVL